MARNILLWWWFIIYYCYFVWHFSSFLTSLYFDRFLPAIQGRWIWAKHCGSDNVSSRTSCKFMLKNITDRHQFLDFDDSCDYIWKYIMPRLWQWIKQIYVIWSFLPLYSCRLSVSLIGNSTKLMYGLILYGFVWHNLNDFGCEVGAVCSG